MSMSMQDRKRGLALRCGAASAIFGALALPAVPSFAQDRTGEASDGGLEEIVVTARKRSENLQETPVAVSAVTGDTLDERGINDIAGAAKFVPSLVFNTGAPIAGASNSAVVFIRGIGQTDFQLTIDPGVGTYLDGVYISRSVGAVLDTADIERLEVLRGPQGTLFGKNTIGGAISITSKRPGADLEGAIELTTGSYDRFDMRGMINIPVAEAVRLRMAGSMQTRDGYVEILTDGSRRGNKNSYSGRLTAEIDLADNFLATIAVDGTRSREQSSPWSLRAVNPDSVFGIFHNVFLNAPVCGVFGPAGPQSDALSTNPNCFSAQWITGNPFVAWEDSGDTYARWRQPGQTIDIPARTLNRSATDVWGTSLTLHYDGSDAFGLKSITAYRSLDAAFYHDTDNTPLAITRTDNFDYSHKQFSQEFQASGALLDSRFKYLIGAFYFKESGTDLAYLNTPPVLFQSGGRVRNTSYALFSQMTYELTDRLSITGGLRYTDEVKRFTPDQYVIAVHPAAQAPLPPGSPFPFYLTNPLTSTPTNPQPIRAGDRILPQTTGRVSYQEMTPSASINYKASDDVFAYLNYSKGFKGGGFTSRVFPPEAEIPSFKPEIAELYEVGLKSMLFDRRLRLNTALFWTDYKELQIVVNDGFAPKVRNAGRARIRGVEVEMEAALADGIMLQAGGSYIDARYLEVDPRAAPLTVDNSLVETPKWSFNAAATVDLFSWSSGKLVWNGDWSYKSRVYKDAINTPFTSQPGFHLINTSLTAKMGDGMSVTAGVTNLTDKAYILSGYTDFAFTGQSQASYARPREWYLRLKASF